MRKILLTLILAATLSFLIAGVSLAVEPAPRITDREIIERLTTLAEGQKRLEQKIEQESARLEQKIEQESAKLHQEILAVRAELKAEIQATNRRIDDISRRIDDTNKRIDDIKWMLGIFISVALVMLGFVIRMLWILQKKMSSVETEQDKQRKEIEFLMDMIRKLLPER